MAKKILVYWLPLLLWCSVIFFLSSIPHLKTNLGLWDLLLRKIAHMTEYAVLFLLSRRALAATFPLWQARTICLAAIAFSVLYAMSDEFHQSFVPGRGPSLIDVDIDTVGALFGYLGYRLAAAGRQDVQNA